MWGKQDSIKSLKDTVLFLLDSGKTNQALKVIHDFVERIITEPLCTSQILGSKTLDDLCQRIGKASLSNINLETSGAPEQEKPVFVYLVTKLQKSGGHTRVIEDFIRAQPAGRHIILSTELDGASDINYLMDGIAKQCDVEFEQAPKVSYQQRLIWLQKRLLELPSKRVFLFNHHHDSVAIAAIQPEMELNSCFYHHGDHHLCLGVHVSHFEHIDFHSGGYHHCRDELGIDNTYIPLTVNDKGKRTDTSFMNNNMLTTCTAARSNKIEVPYIISYLEVIPQLLELTKGKHIHIGRLTPWALFRIRRRLKQYDIPLDNFIYIPWVESVWKSLHEHQVDLYIASFPYGGGLTLIEAMGASIPLAIHQHIFSRVLSGVDIAYPEAFGWRYPDELLNYCASLDADVLKEQGHLSRMQYEEFHSQDDLQSFLSDMESKKLSPKALSENYHVENDEWVNWMSNQMTIKNVCTRFFYRTYRRLRAVINQIEGLGKS